MNWADIPSLAALRAFEAAARAGSLSAAARELNVTHAAIAQHLRALEGHFGRPLMKRQGRGMVLTDAGSQLIGPLQEGFEQIAGGVQSLSQQTEGAPLVLSVTPSFAETWLMPRLGRFWADHPDIPLSIQPSFALVDFRRDPVDMAIRYGAGDWPGLDVTYLTGAHYVIVGAPEIATDIGPRNIPDLAGLPFIFEPAYPEARRWLKDHGLDVPEGDIRPLPTFGMVLSAAREGAGLTVLSRAIVERDLQEGSLVAICEAGDTHLAYWVCTRKNIVTPRLDRLKRWLLSVV